MKDIIQVNLVRIFLINTVDLFFSIPKWQSNNYANVK